MSDICRKIFKIGEIKFLCVKRLIVEIVTRDAVE